MKDTRVAVLAAIFCGGFIAGTLDIGAASLINWLSPVIILRAIASGLLGKASFHDGAPAALLGLGLQWAMSLVIAAVYALGALRLSALTHHWMAGGVVYGWNRSSSGASSPSAACRNCEAELPTYVLHLWGKPMRMAIELAYKTGHS